MGLEDLNKNAEWSEPTLVEVSSISSPYDFKLAGLSWKEIDGFFESYDSRTLKQLFSYLNYCIKVNRKPKYMREEALLVLPKIFDYVHKVNIPYGKSKRYKYWFPSVLLGEVSNPKMLFTPQICKQWVLEADEWASNLGVEDVNGPGDLRDAMYRISLALEDALTKEDTGVISYIQDWAEALSARIISKN